MRLKPCLHPSILSIDQGTTSSRAVVYDSSTFAVLAVPSRRSSSITRATAGSSTSRRTSGTRWPARCAKPWRTPAVMPKDVAAIGITNQRETAVVWDRATGRPAHRAIVWQDRRTTDFCREHAADQPMLTAKTGLVLDPYFSGTKFRWMLENAADLKPAAEAGKLASGTVDSFLIWRLTGGASHVTDATNASRTLLFNIHSMQWDDELLQLLRRAAAMLPEVKPSAAEFGVTKGLDFLPDGIPIRGVAGDQQAALYGQGCFRPGEGKCTYGTGAFFLLHTGDAAVASKHKLLTTVAAMTDPKPKYALEGAVFIAGAAVQWLRDGLHLFRSSRGGGAAGEGVEPGRAGDVRAGLRRPRGAALGAGGPRGDLRADPGDDRRRPGPGGAGGRRVPGGRPDRRGREGQGERAPGRGTAGVGPCSRSMAACRANDWFLQFQADVLGRPVARAATPNRRRWGRRSSRRSATGLADEPKLAGGAPGRDPVRAEDARRRPREEAGRVAQGRRGRHRVLLASLRAGPAAIPMQRSRSTFANLDGTESFGRRLGALLFPGAVVGLVGPLGAGKTHLVRAITEGLGIVWIAGGGQQPDLCADPGVRCPACRCITSMPTGFGRGDFSHLGVHTSISRATGCAWSSGPTASSRPCRLIDWELRSRSSIPSGGPSLSPRPARSTSGFFSRSDRGSSHVMARVTYPTPVAPTDPGANPRLPPRRRSPAGAGAHRVQSPSRLPG